ncbi:MAG: Rne/Rng family ribonuclease [Pseudomonadota bacterium]
MSAEILINAGVGEIRIAHLCHGRLEELSFERTIGGPEDARRCHSHIGDVILGRVQRVLPGMQAAFVDIGLERAGFLGLREAKILAHDTGEDIAISDCVREGDGLLVQVIKDPIGDKGARLSAGITLPGRLLVMTPGQEGVAVSRRIEDEPQRETLIALGERLLTEEAKNLPPGAGIIFRTAAQGASQEELALDARTLGESWRCIQDRSKSARAPATLYRDLGPIERAMRDVVRGDVARVLIDDASAVEAARAYCRKVMPGAENRIKLAGRRLFEDHGLEEEIARLSQPRVALPCGGWITIEATEALTAVDVNSGSFTQSGGLEETSLAVNLEAAAEIGRQIRLRGIGGLIVVDFIHLGDDANGARVIETLEQSLSFDRAPLQISPMTEFGIVAVTRKRLREPLARRTSIACSTCGGTGRAVAPDCVALEILRRVEREAAANPGAELVVTAAPDVVAWLTRHADEIGPALLRRGAGRVRFEAGECLGRRFDVARR